MKSILATPNTYNNLKNIINFENSLWDFKLKYMNAGSLLYSNMQPHERSSLPTPQQSQRVTPSPKRPRKGSVTSRPNETMSNVAPNTIHRQSSGVGKSSGKKNDEKSLGKTTTKRRREDASAFEESTKKSKLGDDDTTRPDNQVTKVHGDRDSGLEHYPKQTGSTHNIWIWRPKDHAPLDDEDDLWFTHDNHFESINVSGDGDISKKVVDGDYVEDDDDPNMGFVTSNAKVSGRMVNVRRGTNDEKKQTVTEHVNMNEPTTCHKRPLDFKLVTQSIPMTVIRKRSLCTKELKPNTVKGIRSFFSNNCGLYWSSKEIHDRCKIQPPLPDLTRLVTVKRTHFEGKNFAGVESCGLFVNAPICKDDEFYENFYKMECGVEYLKKHTIVATFGGLIKENSKTPLDERVTSETSKLFLKIMHCNHENENPRHNHMNNVGDLVHDEHCENFRGCYYFDGKGFSMNGSTFNFEKNDQSRQCDDRSHQHVPDLGHFCRRSNSPNCKLQFKLLKTHGNQIGIIITLKSMFDLIPGTELTFSNVTHEHL